MNEQVTLIQPKRGIHFPNLAELWQHRELLLAFVKRDVTSRYRQTIVGGSWAIIQPFTTMIVFSFFFGKLANIPSDNVPYPIFSYAGLLLWTYFSAALSSASNSLVSSSSLITKVYFPRLIIPLASTLYGLVDYLVASIILIFMMLYYQVSFSPLLLLLPFIMLITWLLASGFGFFFSAINVVYRDVRYALPFFIQLWLYVTPIIYPSSVAGRFSFIIWLNPLSGLVEAHRAIILNNPIHWPGIILSLIYAILAFVLGAIFFNHIERKFADVI